MANRSSAAALRIASLGLYRCAPAWRLDGERTRAWRDLDLWLLLDGAGRVETPEGIFRLAPGSCLVMRGGEPYVFTPDPRRRFRHWFVHFDRLDAAGRPLPPADAPWPRFRQLDGHAFLAGLIERAADAWYAGSPDATGWLAAALLEVERADAARARPADPWRRELDALVQALREEPGQIPTLAAMAARLGLSHDRFTRVFRARTGLAPRAFLVQLRLERARTLLADSALSVQAVGEACGFGDPSFFVRHFAAHQGISPGAWRRGRRHPGGGAADQPRR